MILISNYAAVEILYLKQLVVGMYYSMSII